MDKRQVQIANVQKNTSEVCKKDGKFMSKFWGEEDTDATDSTIEPETDTELHQATSPSASKYLVTDNVKKGTRGRPKKQRSPKDKVGNKSPEQGIASVHTRAQKLHNNNKNTQ